jgi:predicted aminopeptidase
VFRSRALLALLLLSSCWTGNYLAQQGVGQLRILNGRRKITDVIADRSTSADLRARLSLARAARQFGVERLGLRGGDNFTRFYDTGGRPVAWNLTAAPKDSLQPVTWNFPIAGRVPYLGFFREADANREAARLRAAGFDVYVRDVSAYSTIGWLSDPVYTSMLDGPPERIVEVVLHEMFHGTVYLPGAGSWNESLATFVGLQGAARFFAESGRADVGPKMFADAKRHTETARMFSDFLRPFVVELEALYRAHPPDLPARRAEVFAKIRAEFLRRWPGREKASFLNGDQGGLNNAVIASFAVYHTATPNHARLLNALGGDLGEFIDLHKTAIERDDPLGWLRWKTRGFYRRARTK